MIDGIRIERMRKSVERKVHFLISSELSNMCQAKQTKQMSFKWRVTNPALAGFRNQNHVLLIK